MAARLAITPRLLLVNMIVKVKNKARNNTNMKTNWLVSFSGSVAKMINMHINQSKPVTIRVGTKLRFRSIKRPFTFEVISHYIANEKQKYK